MFSLKKHYMLDSLFAVLMLRKSPTVKVKSRSSTLKKRTTVGWHVQLSDLSSFQSHKLFVMQSKANKWWPFGSGGWILKNELCEGEFHQVFKCEAAGQVVLLFSSIWKPDETRSTSFWNDFSKETLQNYAVLYFSHFSFKGLVCVICCIHSAFIVFVSFC